MIVQDGPLRSYDDPVSISFLRDILDGYFPSELQEAYPEGVPFKVKFQFKLCERWNVTLRDLSLGWGSQAPSVLKLRRFPWPGLSLG